MSTELSEPSRNKNKLYILLAVIFISAISIILISVAIANSDPIDGGG